MSSKLGDGMGVGPAELLPEGSDTMYCNSLFNWFIASISSGRGGSILPSRSSSEVLRVGVRAGDPYGESDSSSLGRAANASGIMSIK